MGKEGRKEGMERGRKGSRREEEEKAAWGFVFLFTKRTFGTVGRERMENPVKASPRAIMSHLLNPVESESLSVSSRDEEDSFQEMPLKLVKREIENSTDDEFDDDLEEEEQDVTQAKQRIIVDRPVIYTSSLTHSRQVNELSNIFLK